MNKLTLTAAFAALALVWTATGAEPPAADDTKPASGSGNPAGDVKETPVAAVAPASAESRLTIMPAAFTSFGAAVQGDYLYAIGGHTSKAHSYDRDGFNTTFWRLNLRDRTSWETLPGGVALQSVALVSAADRIVRIGGMTALNAPGETQNLRSTDEAATFDPLTREWSNLPKLPQPRSSHDAVAVGSKVYVFGGWKLAGEGDNGEWHDSGLVIDLAAANPKWEPVAQPFKKRALALAEAGGKIFAMGGMTDKGLNSEVSVFDIAEGKWSEGPVLPKSSLGGFAISAFGANRRAYVTMYEGGMYSAAPGETEWRAEGTLTYPRMFHRLVHVGGDEFAAVAGTAKGSHVRNVEWIKPRSAGPAITRVNVPAPGAAKTRQGIFFFNNTLYVFGGNNSVKDHQFGPTNFVDEAFAINLNTLSAQRIAKLPVKRQSFVTFMTGTQDRFGEKLGYAVGGFWHDGKAALSTSEILQYSLDADVWEPAKLKLPNALTQFGIAEHGGKIYLFGGMNFDPARGTKERFQESETVWCYDPKPPETKEGEKGPGPREFVPLETKLPTKRRAFGGAVVGDKYYIVGGMTKDFEEVDRCDVYDFKTGEWSTIPQPSDVRLSPKLVPLDGKLYLVGGSSPTEQGMARNGSIEEFDPATGKWRTIIHDVGGDLGELQAFAFGHRILLYSVHNEENEIRLLFIKP